MRDLLERLYKRNLLYQQVNFKWKSYTNVRKLVRNLPRSATQLRKTLVISVFLLVYLVDFVLGCVALIVIHKYGLGVYITRGVSSYTLTMLEWTQDLVVWTMGIPAGLKLNTPLGHFIGDRCLTILGLWNIFYTDFIVLYLTGIMSGIFLSSLFGLTVFLSLLHDFLKFLNLCLVCFLVIMFRIFILQLSALKSLARLFTGKKWNVLRQRVDSCDYDTSQLLVGTLFFTILLFLLPTTGVFLSIFLLLRLVQFTVQFALRTATVTVNNITVYCWRFVYQCLQKAPITDLRIIVLRGENTIRVERVVWNGRDYSLQKAKCLVNSYPTGKAMVELGGGRSYKIFEELGSHPMLGWIGGLPLYPRP